MIGLKVLEMGGNAVIGYRTVVLIAKIRYYEHYLLSVFILV